MAVPGHVEYLRLRPRHRESCGELDAVHARHDDVGDEQIDRILGGGCNAQCVFGAARGKHPVPEIAEHVTHQGAHVRLVFHEDDGLAAGDVCQEILCASDQGRTELRMPPARLWRRGMEED